MFVLVPLGGAGERFRSAGYTDPKPFVRVDGRCILDWVLDHLQLPAGWQLLLPYAPSLAEHGLEAHVRGRHAGLTPRFFRLPRETRGAAETAALGLEALLSDAERKLPALCMDADTFYTCDVVRRYLDSGGGNRVFCFPDTGADAIYSYVETDGGQAVRSIVEKRKISDWACSGVYGFGSGADLITHAHGLMERGITQKGEYFLSGVIASMLGPAGAGFEMIPLARSEVHCLGTPAQAERFAQQRAHDRE